MIGIGPCCLQDFESEKLNLLKANKEDLFSFSIRFSQFLEIDEAKKLDGEYDSSLPFVAPEFLTPRIVSFL